MARRTKPEQKTRGCCSRQGETYIPRADRTLFAMGLDELLPDNTEDDRRYGGLALLVMDDVFHAPLDWSVSKASPNRRAVYPLTCEVMACISTRYGIPTSVLLLRTDRNGRTPIEAMVAHMYGRYQRHVEDNPLVAESEDSREVYWESRRLVILKLLGLWQREVLGRASVSQTSVIHDGFMRQMWRVVTLLWQDALLPAVDEGDTVAQASIWRIMHEFSRSPLNDYLRFYKGDARLAGIVKILLDRLQLQDDCEYDSQLIESVRDMLVGGGAPPPSLERIAPLTGDEAGDAFQERLGALIKCAIQCTHAEEFLKSLPAVMLDFLRIIVQHSTHDPDAPYARMRDVVRHHVPFARYDEQDKTAFRVLDARISGRFRESCDCRYDLLCSRAFALLSAGCSPTSVAKLCLSECQRLAGQNRKVCEVFAPRAIVLSLATSIAEAYAFLPGQPDMARAQPYSIDHLLELVSCESESERHVVCRRRKRGKLAKLEKPEPVRTGELHYWWIMDCAQALRILLGPQMRHAVGDIDRAHVTSAAERILRELCHVPTKPAARFAYLSLVTTLKDLK